ncbi:T6SS immunity protein Tli3 family protein, partial [Caballeronia glebae]
PHQFTYADFEDAKVLPYDVPPQVIYRIDDYRFITLEHYRDCSHGDTYYNDSKTSIRTYLGRGGIENYQGTLIIADSSERNVVIPSSAPPNFACSDRGCTVSMIYSTDSGKTFRGTKYMLSFDPYSDSRDMTIVATSDSIYVARRSAIDTMVDKYPLNPAVDLNKPYPPGFLNEGAWAAKRKLMPDNLHSPSGQERLSCDASIRPSNPDAPLN